ncbi:MAG: DUF3108 domain-containing protein [Candidatus Krumholzibacteriia bacterium]
MMTRNVWVYWALVATVVVWGGAPSAQTGADSTMTPPTPAKEMEAVADTAAGPWVGGVTDSLLPDFVPFGEGEKLVFAVQYGIITAGEATLEIRNVSDVGGIACYNIVSNARTNDAFSAFFKVRDRFVSLMDTTELVSLKYEKHLREGKFKRDEGVTFDQSAHKAQYKDKVVQIAPRTQDILSSMYYVRALPLQVGQTIALANHTDGKNYPLAVKVLREEKVTVDAGTFDCLVVEPFLQGPGLFNQKGRLTVWVTNDRYKIPVLMKSKVFIGAVAAVLKSYRLADKLNHDEQVRSRGSQ